VNCLKNNFKMYIKIDIKTAPTYFGAATFIRGPLFDLAKVTVVKTINLNYIGVVNSVVWLHMLLGPCSCVYVALIGIRL
jgi:hypothetical protein